MYMTLSVWLVTLQLLACGCSEGEAARGDANDSTMATCAGSDDDMDRDAKVRVIDEHYDNGQLRCRDEFAPNGRLLRSTYYDEEGDIMAAWEGAYHRVENYAFASPEEIESFLDAREKETDVVGLYFKGSSTLNDHHLAQLAEWRQLRWINIKLCEHISDAAVDALIQQRPHLRVMR